MEKGLINDAEWFWILIRQYLTNIPQSNALSNWHTIKSTLKIQKYQIYTTKFYLNTTHGVLGFWGSADADCMPEMDQALMDDMEEKIFKPFRGNKGKLKLRNDQDWGAQQDKLLPIKGP